ncbi:hypothetical protein BST22_11935 [Mycolicibacterium chubuense]|jgi:hypothetical protein|uniref:Uncharacterized protein n=1 Tax=Mycolicibacterium chubuense TaxID=1800 RepID=A0A0J6VR89_MYCCU|nr:hypothetical protein [Mycolicibacterium chubuense]KMO73555.1 hypothetical protein MCHUDSM44219_04128 [Mycolicibacterium chubuense]ORA52712.1 hypothetical protein BST22_11935 [Mycolicibacterium chubuense]SPX98436.1 Uncharacterised protein [Mycolicibacterium chubuense]
MSIRPQPVGPLAGSAVFLIVTTAVALAGFNLTAVAAALNPLLGLVTLLVTTLLLLAVADRVGERCVPAAMRAFRSWCRGTVRHLRTGR